MAIAMRLRNQLQAVYKMDPLRNEVACAGPRMRMREGAGAGVDAARRVRMRGRAGRGFPVWPRPSWAELRGVGTCGPSTPAGRG